MAKTQAERSRAYRRKKRDGERDVTVVTNVTATVYPRDPTDLPPDVVDEIERMCAESNNGQRASSHGRVAMVERAMRYQERCGRR